MEFEKIQEGDIVHISFLSFDEMISSCGLMDEGYVNSKSHLDEQFWKLIKHGGEAQVLKAAYDNDEDFYIRIEDPFSGDEMVIYPEIVSSIRHVKRNARVKLRQDIEDYLMITDCLNTCKIGITPDYFLDHPDDQDIHEADDSEWVFELSKNEARILANHLNQWLHGDDPSVAPNKAA